MNKKELNIVYSFDDGYCQHGGVSLMSLLDNNKDVSVINIYVIDGGISAENRSRLTKIAETYNRKLEFVDLDVLVSSMKVATSFSKSAYGRIFISDYLDCDLIFYLDSDTVVSGSLMPLLDLWNGVYVLGGVQDTVNPYYLYTIGHDDSDRYINSGGVLVFNAKKWRDERYTDKCVDFIEKWGGCPPHNDQGTLNAVCRGNIMILPAAYNVMPPMFKFTASQLVELFKMNTYYSDEELSSAVANPVVIHYTEEFFTCPWFSNCTHPLRSRYLHYLSLSPWRNAVLPFHPLSTNCRIQNAVKHYLPFYFYKLMVRFITWKHRK